ncbi:hypothetical protein [Microbacterium amylolyticum]|uniref:Lipoprotein n=1 Tax=Microbacterium amylolyticum TaxID=936337 RepID=A0ABS4ZHA9_9MICO|nr:hypothetical protein [Microbacterium amylolyticum]MBP2436663.1 hypothetical protein [Microbacterium amylolyticum]
MKKSTARIAAIAGALALVPAGLVACSGGQSVADACQIIEDELNTVQMEAQEAMGSIMTDPEGAVTALETVNNKVQEIDGQVTQEDVSAAFSEFADGYGQIIVAVTASADDPEAIDITALDAAQTSMTNGLTELQTHCG